MVSSFFAIFLYPTHFAGFWLSSFPRRAFDRRLFLFQRFGSRFGLQCSSQHPRAYIRIPQIAEKHRNRIKHLKRGPTLLNPQPAPSKRSSSTIEQHRRDENAPKTGASPPLRHNRLNVISGLSTTKMSLVIDQAEGRNTRLRFPSDRRLADLRVFEQRLMECISSLQPDAFKWKGSRSLRTSARFH